MNAFADHLGPLSLLAGVSDPLPALLAKDDGRRWRRTYGRFHPQQLSYCTLLYEADGDPLPRRVSLYHAHHDASLGRPVPGLGLARIELPTTDEALDTLGDVLARHNGVQIVRYRPLHRCTFRAAHTPSTGQYVKVFAHPDTARKLHAGVQTLWAHRSELGFAVAQPLAFDDQARFAAQTALPGTSLVSELLGARGLEVAAATARAAATLPLSSLADVPGAGDDDTLERSQHYVAKMVELLPEYGDRLRARLSRLQQMEQACAPARRLAIHGALHPSQWLRCGDGLGLVDFDRLGIGDPELDVATFITELRYEGSAAVPAEQLCRAFTAAYAERVPLDARRVALYVAHKELSKLMRLARAPRPDAPQRFARALERLEQADPVDAEVPFLGVMP